MKSSVPILSKDTFSTQAAGTSGSHLLDILVDTHEDAAVYCEWTGYRIRSLNMSAAHMLGVARREAIGKGLFTLMQAELPPTAMAEIASLRAEPELIVEQQLKINGEHDFSIKAAAFMDGIMFLIRNNSKNSGITEETNFKMLFENMSSGFVFLKGITDADGNITGHQVLDVNSAFEIYFDKDKVKVVGKQIEEVIPNIDEALTRILTKSALTGNSYSGSYYHPATKKHFEVRTYSPRKGFSAAVFNDIKHEIEVRNDLMIKNEISKAFALGHDASLYKVVLDFVLKNTGCRDGFIGYVHQGREVICLAHNDKRYLPSPDANGDLILEIKNNGLEIVFDSKEQLLETNTFDCNEILTTPVMDNDRVIGIIACTDPQTTFTQKAKNFVQGLADYISPLMVAEIKERQYKCQLVEEKERAEQNEKLKTAFLANISHEVRTPMNSIIGFGQLLSKSATLSSKDRLYVDYISQASKRLLYIIENIMEMSKLQTQQSKATISSVNINSMLKIIYNEMETFARAKHIDLIPQPSVSDDDSNIVTDSYKVKKTLTCLISNGIKFTNKGSVSYGYTIEDDYITFFVRDTGIGIRKELHESIFTSFQQAENVLERKYDGVGVGLSLCKGYIDILGGSIWLESAPNEGSTFYFRLKNLHTQTS